jgi:hypothetical protein
VGKHHQKAFESLKSALCEEPLLQVPDYNRDILLVTDESDLAFSAVIHQRVN